MTGVGGRRGGDRSSGRGRGGAGGIGGHTTVFLFMVTVGYRELPWVCRRLPEVVVKWSLSGL